mgnify:CR=1 FL=1
MELEKINELLQQINASLSQDITLKLDEKNIEDIGNKLDSIVNKTDAKVFEMNENELFKDIEEGVGDFSSFVQKAVEQLKKFDKFNYYKSLKSGDVKDPKKRQDLVAKKEEKISKLIEKIEKIGQMDKYIKEVESRYNDKEMESTFSKENEKNERLYEKTNEQRLALEEFKNSSKVQIAFEQLRAIDNKSKKEEELKKCEKQISDINDEITNLSDKDLIERYKEELKELEGKRTSIKNEINNIDNIIRGKTIDNIKNDIRNAVPDNVDKDKIEQILSGSDIEEGFENLDQEYLTNMMVYKHRGEVEAARTEQLKIGRDEKKHIVRPPIDINDPSLDLTEEDEKSIREQYESNDETVKEYRKRAKEEIEKYPTNDLINDTKKYLKEKNGKNFLKNLFNIVNARRTKTQDAYKEDLIEKKVKEMLELEMRKKKRNKKQEEAERESKSKTKTLDSLSNTFKESIRQAAMKMSNDELKQINDKGNYGEQAIQTYTTMHRKETEKADEEYLK